MDAKGADDCQTAWESTLISEATALGRMFPTRRFFPGVDFVGRGNTAVTITQRQS